MTVPAEQPMRATIGLTPVVIFGVVVVVLFFGVLGGWATFAPLQSAAIAPGVVSVESSRKTIKHLEGGIVSEILVRDGDRVSAGQVLIRLDDTLTRSTLDRLKGRRDAALALEARLLAERDGGDEIRFPPALLARRAEPKIAEILDGQVSIFAARRDAVIGQTGILQQRIAQFETEIRGVEGQIRAEDTQLRLIASEITGIASLVEKGLAKRSRLLALERRAAEIGGGRSRNTASIARTRQRIGETHLRITELRTQRINEVVEALRADQDDLSDLGERIRAAENVLRRTQIRAQLDGRVVGLKVHTPGGVVGPGEALMDIVPSDVRLIVEAKVDPGDIDVVRAGMAAQIRLTAFSQRNLAPLAAKVLSVSADRLTDERSGAPYFLARVAVNKLPDAALQGMALYPGMQAEVMIVTGERTALDYLLQPFMRSFRRAFREN